MWTKCSSIYVDKCCAEMMLEITRRMMTMVMTRTCYLTIRNGDGLLEGTGTRIGLDASFSDDWATIPKPHSRKGESVI